MDKTVFSHSLGSPQATGMRGAGQDGVGENPQGFGLAPIWGLGFDMLYCDYAFCRDY